MKQAPQPITQPEPTRYAEVAESLRALVHTLPAGARLPSFAQLERQLGVSNSTIKAAMEILRRDNLIVSKRASGTYVAERPQTGADDAVTDPALETLRTGFLVAFAPTSNAFFHECGARLAAQSARLGVRVECRYGDRPLTLDDALFYERYRPDGFVVFGGTLEWLAAALVERAHRVVLVGEVDADTIARVPAVSGNAQTGGYVAARRLLDLGHRRIAFAHTMPARDAIRKTRRWRGYTWALGEAQIPEPYETITGDQFAQWDDDPEAARRFFARPDAPTGIVAWSDAQAAMLLTTLRRAGLRVPEDVSIIGYDNLAFSAHTRPALDTVDQHLDAQLRRALSLLALADPAEPASTTQLTPTLLTRASCAPPR